VKAALANLVAASALALGLPTSAKAALANTMPTEWRAGGDSRNKRKGVAGHRVDHKPHGRRPLVKAMGGRRQYLKTVKALRRLQREGALT
jgi:hypothetical protein